MLKKLAIVAAFAASSVAAVPAKADPPSSCMLANGCYYEQDHNGNGDAHWVCLDPAVYALCDPL